LYPADRLEDKLKKCARTCRWCVMRP